MEPVPGKRIVGIQAVCSNDHPEEIGSLWGRFHQEDVAARVGGSGVFAVYFDYSGDYTQPYTLLIGVEVDDARPLPAGLQEVHILSGQYECFDASGPQPESIIVAWQRIWKSPVRRAYRTDFEQYGEDGSAAIFIGSL